MSNWKTLLTSNRKIGKTMELNEIKHGDAVLKHEIYRFDSYNYKNRTTYLGDYKKLILLKR